MIIRKQFNMISLFVAGDLNFDIHTTYFTF